MIEPGPLDQSEIAALRRAIIDLNVLLPRVQADFVHRTLFNTTLSVEETAQAAEYLVALKKIEEALLHGLRIYRSHTVKKLPPVKTLTQQAEHEILTLYKEGLYNEKDLSNHYRLPPSKIVDLLKRKGVLKEDTP